jgi:hypothetical protein
MVFPKKMDFDFHFDKKIFFSFVFDFLQKLHKERNYMKKTGFKNQRFFLLCIRFFLKMCKVFSLSMLRILFDIRRPYIWIELYTHYYMVLLIWGGEAALLSRPINGIYMKIIFHYDKNIFFSFLFDFL